MKDCFCANYAWVCADYAVWSGEGLRSKHPALSHKALLHTSALQFLQYFCTISWRSKFFKIDIMLEGRGKAHWRLPNKLHACCCHRNCGISIVSSFEFINIHRFFVKQAKYQYFWPRLIPRLAQCMLLPTPFWKSSWMQFCIRMVGSLKQLNWIDIVESKAMRDFNQAVVGGWQT